MSLGRYIRKHSNRRQKCPTEKLKVQVNTVIKGKKNVIQLQHKYAINQNRAGCPKIQSLILKFAKGQLMNINADDLRNWEPNNEEMKKPSHIIRRDLFTDIERVCTKNIDI